MIAISCRFETDFGDIKLMLLNSKIIFNYIIENINSVYDKTEADSIARIILEEKFNCSFTDVLIGKCIDIPSFDVIKDIISRLNNNEPIQYILGKCRFCNIDMLIDRRALIPRPETEEMVFDIIETVECKGEMRILDLCTGSGCISLALKRAFPQTHVFAVDISNDALDLAKANARKNDLDIHFIKADILSHDIVDKLGFDYHSFDIIVSNPPYVCISEKENMHKRVLNYEPSEALFVSDEAPLVFYESIKNITNKLLSKKGYCFVEINERFVSEVKCLFKNECVYAEIKKDFNNKDRWVAIQKETLVS